MKLVHPDFFCQIEFADNIMPVLVLEHQKVFRNFVQQLRSQLQGNDEGWVLSDEGKLLKLPQMCNMVVDPYALDVNQKKMLSSVYSQLEREVNATELVIDWNAMLSSMYRVSDEILKSVEYDLVYRDNVELVDFLKFMDVRFEKQAENLVERLIDYFNLTEKIMGVCLFVLVNFKSYLTQRELNYLYEQAVYRNYYFLLVENQAAEIDKSFEKVIIVDRDSCLIC